MGLSRNIARIIVSDTGEISASNLGAVPPTPEVLTPSNVSPANAATDEPETPTLTASTFYSLYGFTHSKSQWQVSTVSNFATTVVSTGDVDDLTSYTVSAGVLSENTEYYWRVRYKDSNGSYSAYSTATTFTTAASFGFSADFLVIAGGGGGGNGGGGAGGYREFSEQTIDLSTNYTVTVGAGGASTLRGSNSVFGAFSSSGGGGSSTANPLPPEVVNGGSGAGSGGQSGFGVGNAGGYTPPEGNNGGSTTTGQYLAGGGGAGAVGGNGSSGVVGAGGAGTASSITGSSVTRAGGGGGAAVSGGGGAGGAGGGGPGEGYQGAGGGGQAGTTNTGSGGGGGYYISSGAGGSGVVIIKYPDSVTISNPGGGLTYSTATAGGFSVTTFTAGTGNVSWS